MSSSNDDEYIEIRPVRPDEVKAVEACINRSFSQDPTKPSRQHFFKKLDYIKRDRPEFFWGVFRYGKPVSGLLLFPFHIMLEYTPVHLLEMTGVGTDPEFRHRGYASKLIQKVHKSIQMEGFDGIVLHSAADALYIKHDYQTVFCDHTVYIQWTIASSSQLRKLIDQFSPQKTQAQIYYAGEVTEVISEELYSIRRRSDQFIHRPIRQIRYPYYFHQRLQQHLDEGALLVSLTRGREVIAYAIASYRANKLIIFEQYSLENEESDFLLLWQTLINEFDISTGFLEVKTYPTDKKVLKLAKHLNGNYEINRDTKNMVHLYDARLILPWMQTTFCHRVSDSPYHDLQEEFLLRIEDARFYFRITRNIVSLIEIDEKFPPTIDLSDIVQFHLSKRQWIALTFGYYSVDEIFYDIIPSREVTRYASYKKILNILYPPQNAVWDYFDSL